MRTYLSLIIVFIFIVLNGCSGRGGSTTGNQTKSVSGKVIDGYIQKAIVFADLNNNGYKDDFEPSTMTDDNGFYTLEINEGSLNVLTTIVAYDGMEEYTKKQFHSIAKNMYQNRDGDGHLHLSGITTLVTERYGYLKNVMKKDDFSMAMSDVATFLQIETADTNRDVIKHYGNNYKNFRANITLFQIIEKMVGSNQNYQNSKTAFANLAKDMNLSNALKNDIEDFVTQNSVDLYPVLISKDQVQVDENIALSPSGLFTLLHPKDGIVTNGTLYKEGVLFNGILNYESSSSKVYDFILKTGNVEYPVKIEVKDQPDEPLDITLSNLSVNENTLAGAVVGFLNTDDEDNNDSFRYVLNTSNTPFEIINNALQIKNGFNLNYESGTTNYTLSISSIDSTNKIKTKNFIISIVDINEAPVIEDRSLLLTEDTVYNGSLSAVDPESDTFTFALIEKEALGSLIFANNGHFTYTPIANFFGIESFQYKACDQKGLCSSPKRITMNIQAVNDAPIPTVQGTYTLNEDASDAILSLLATDPENHNISFQLLTSPTKITLNWNENGSVTYTPMLNQNGIDSFTYRACDTLGACSAIQTINFNITPQNDSPTNISLSNSTIVENITNGSLVGVLNTSDVDTSDSFTYTLVSGNGATDNNKFQILGNELKTNSTIDYEQQMTYSVRIKTIDQSGAGYEKQFTINVSNLADAVPLLTDSSLSIQDNTSGNIGTVIVASIGDSSISHYTINSDETAKCTVTASGQISLSGTLVAGTYTVTITATNTQGTSAPIIVTIIVSSTPVPILNNSTFTLVEDVTGGTIVGSVSVINNGGGIVSYTFTDISSENKFSLNTSTGQISVASDAVFDFETKTLYQFKVRAENSIPNSSNEVIISINISNANEAPIAITSSFTLNEDELYLTTLEGMDVDAHTTLIFTKMTDPSHGSLTAFNTNGSISYSPNQNYNGSDSFKYKVSDGSLDSAEQTVNITINPMNDAPVFNTPINTININEDVAFSQVYNVSDVDSATLNVFIATNTDALPLQLVQNSSTQWTLSGTLDDSYVGTKTITLSVSDGDKVTSMDITLNVSNVNDKPKANIPSSNVIVGIGKTLLFSIYGVDDGDISVAQSVTLSEVTSSNSSILSVGSVDTNGNDGVVSMNLTGNLSGTSTVTFSISDGIETMQYQFNVSVEADSGFIAYHVGKLQNYPAVELDIAGGGSISYSWNSTNKWYEGIEPTSSNPIILVPIQALLENDELYFIGNGTNLIKADFGHYYVRKSDYLSDTHIAAGIQHTTSSTYKNALGQVNALMANNNKFQHDPVHNAFVSRIVLHNVAGDYKFATYNNWIGQGSIFESAPNGSDQPYATSLSLSSYFSGNVTADKNNNGDKYYNICAKTYGEGWRLPTLYEAGRINTTPDSNPNTTAKQGYIPAYMGGTSATVLMSSEYDANNVWRYDTGNSYFRSYSKASEANVKCIYPIY